MGLRVKDICTRGFGATECKSRKLGLVVHGIGLVLRIVTGLLRAGVGFALDP